MDERPEPTGEVVDAELAAAGGLGVYNDSTGILTLRSAGKPRLEEHYGS